MSFHATHRTSIPQTPSFASYLKVVSTKGYPTSNSAGFQQFPNEGPSCESLKLVHHIESRYGRVLSNQNRAWRISGILVIIPASTVHIPSKFVFTVIYCDPSGVHAFPFLCDSCCPEICIVSISSPCSLSI